jgi:tellurite resistance protein TerC
LGIETVGSPLLWGAFLVGVLFMLALDLGVFNKETHRVTSREALTWSIVWVCLSLSFCGFVWWKFGSEPGLEWLSAYVVEKSLSVDNIFVFIVIFRYMKVPRDHLHRVLFAGILGALVLRAIFILVGLGLIEMFSWSLYFFGGFLIFTGIKLLFAHDDGDNEEAGDSWVKRKAEKWLRVTREFEGPKFFVKQRDKSSADGKEKWFVTTLFVCLLMIETADVIFALDSIPAIFGISRDPFIVFTSNVCAVLGLRAMFFLLENVIDRFRYLPYGLGLVLAFIGVKMVLAEGIGGMGLYALGVAHQPWLDPYHVPIGLSLGLVGVILTISVLASLLAPPPSTPEND